MIPALSLEFRGAASEGAGAPLERHVATRLQQHWLCPAALAALWWVIAAGELGRFLGSLVTLLILPLAIGVALIAAARARRKGRIGFRQSYVEAACMGIALLAFAIGFPLAHAHSLAGGGATHSDALDHAAAALLAGHNPYAAQLALGQPLLELPGAVLLALPFHAVAGAALQNPFWLSLLILKLFRDYRGRGAALALLILLNPGIMAGYIAGDDYLADAIIVLFATDFVRATYDAKRSLAMRMPALAALALALSIHPVYWVLVPVIAVYIGVRQDWRTAIVSSLILAVAMAAVILPFYLTAQDAFTPLQLAGMAWSLPAVFRALPLLSFLGALLIIPLGSGRRALMAVSGIALFILLVPPVLLHMALSSFDYVAVFPLPALLFLALGWLNPSEDAVTPS